MTAPGAEAHPTTSGTTPALAALCVAAFLSALNFFATGPFYPSMADDLDTTVPLLGQAATLMLIVSAALGLAVGPIADHAGYRRLLVAGVLAIAANLLGTALAPSYPVLLSLALVGALGDALVFGLSIAMASMIFDGAAQRRAISWTIASLSVGAVLGVPMLTTIGGILGWRAALATGGVGALAVAWLVARSLPADRHVPGTVLSAREMRAAYVPLLAYGPAVRLLAITVLRSLWALGLITYIGAFLGDERRLTTGEIGLYYMLGGAGATAGGVVAGTRLIGSAPRLSIALANVAGGLLMTAIFWAPTAGIIVLLPLVAALSSIVSVGVAALLATVSPAKAGTTMALNASLLNAGAAAGAALGGILIAIGGYRSLAFGLPLFAFAAAILALRRAAPHM